VADAEEHALEIDGYNPVEFILVIIDDLAKRPVQPGVVAQDIE
jgi:hypothetical protein